MEKVSKPKCVVYIRVSSHAQVQGTSLDEQEERCVEYANREKWEVVEIFREEGVTAKMMERPEFINALEYIKKHNVRYFVMFKIDRISRNTEDQLPIMTALRQAGTELRSASENIDETPAGKLLRNMLWAIANFDNDVRAERCRAGLVRRFRQGYWVSVAPPGYLMVRDPITKRSNLEPDPKRASHIKWMFEQRALGKSFDAIAEGMNNRGYRSKHGKRIKQSYVERLIKKTEYTGLMQSFGEQVKGKYKPLVSKELWYRAQAAGKERERGHFARSSVNPLFPLRGLVYCSLCRKNLTGSSPMGRSKHYDYYHHHSKGCTARRSIRKQELERMFEHTTKHLNPKPEFLPIVKMAILDVWNERVGQHIKDQTLLERRISELRNEKKTLLEEKRRKPHLYTDEEFLEQKHDIDNEISQLENERTVEIKLSKDFEDVIERAFVYLSKPYESWKALEVKSKAEFQRALFPDGLPFDGEKFGTAKLSLLVELLQASSLPISHLVQKVRDNWNRIKEEIERFARIYNGSLAGAITTRSV